MFDRLRNMSADSNILARHGLSEQKFSHMNHRASCGARSFPKYFLEKAEGASMFERMIRMAKLLFEEAMSAA